jgi:hypothetical protein
MIELLSNEQLFYRDAELFIKSLATNDLQLEAQLMLILNQEMYATEKVRQENFERIPEHYQLICNWFLDISHNHCSYADNISCMKTAIKNIKNARRVMKIMHNKEIEKSEQENKKYKV